MSAALTPPAKGGQAVVWAAGLGCGAVLAFDPATVLFTLVLLAPTLLMRVLDGGSRSALRCVGFCNVAAAIDPLCRLWNSGMPDVGGAMALLARPTTVPSAWAVSAAAWIGSELLIMIAHQVLRRLDRVIAQLRDEWGSPP